MSKEQELQNLLSVIMEDFQPAIDGKTDSYSAMLLFHEKMAQHKISYLKIISKQQEFFPINVSRDDFKGKGFDVSKLSNEQMQIMVDAMEEGLCESGQYWDALIAAAEGFGLEYDQNLDNQGFDVEDEDFEELASLQNNTHAADYAEQRTRIGNTPEGGDTYGLV